VQSERGAADNQDCSDYDHDKSSQAQPSFNLLLELCGNEKGLLVLPFSENAAIVLIGGTGILRASSEQVAVAVSQQARFRETITLPAAKIHADAAGAERSSQSLQLLANRKGLLQHVCSRHLHRFQSFPRPYHSLLSAIGMSPGSSFQTNVSAALRHVNPPGESSTSMPAATKACFPQAGGQWHFAMLLTLWIWCLGHSV
jgi:hypothetical protein